MDELTKKVFDKIVGCNYDIAAPWNVEKDASEIVELVSAETKRQVGRDILKKFDDDDCMVNTAGYRIVRNVCGIKGEMKK